MYSKMICGTLSGLSAEKISVESDVSFGFPVFHIVGLADTAIKESKERVRSAIVNTGFSFPQERVIVNLSPADIKKEGTHFDLPIALGILSAGQKIRMRKAWTEQNCAFLGELALDGSLVRIRGMLPLLVDLRDAGIKNFFIPWQNLKEAEIVSDITLLPARHLREVVEHVSGESRIAARIGGKRCDIKYSVPMKEEKPDFSEVIGQENAKRALQISASAMHNILMVGSPGCGKSMLARRLSGILPPLTYGEMLELTKIYSICGLIDEDQPLITERPFRTPDTKITPAALVGGGNRPKPGEVTLAHLGVLFLDELPEFSRVSLEALRGPMEDETASISRTGGKLLFPAKFLTVAAMNPCPCGYAGDPARECTCTPYQISRYQSKLSGPFLDRIDLFVHINSQISGNFGKEERDRTSDRRSLSTAELRRGVLQAREAQNRRFERDDIFYNSQMQQRHIKKYCILSQTCEQLLNEACRALKLSFRGYCRILRVARTIADIEGSENIEEKHLAEAITYKERKLG